MVNFLYIFYETQLRHSTFMLLLVVAVCYLAAAAWRHRGVWRAVRAAASAVFDWRRESAVKMARVDESALKPPRLVDLRGQFAKTAFTYARGALAIVFLMPCASMAQGMLIPFIPEQYLNQNAVAAVNYKLCTYQANTTTPMATFADVGLTIPNTNPVVLANGGIYYSGLYVNPSANYKYVLRSAGTDGTCNTGNVLWTRDNVKGLVTSNYQNCFVVSTVTSSFAAQMSACASALPTTGGVLDAGGFQGAQAWDSNWDGGQTKPIDVINLGYATFTISATSSINSKTTLHIGRGACLNPTGGASLTFNSQIVAGDYPIFCNQGALTINAPGPVRAAWWYTTGDGQGTPYASLDGTGGWLAPTTALVNNFPNQVIFPCALINITVTPAIHWGSVGSNSWTPNYQGCDFSGTQFLLIGGASGPAFDTTGRGNGEWLKGRIANMQFTNRAAIGTTVCLSFNNVHEMLVENVGGFACHIGFKSVYSWSYQVAGRSQFRSGDIGIQIQDNGNNVQFIGVDVSNNTTGFDLRADGTGSYSGGSFYSVGALCQGDLTCAYIGSGNNITFQSTYDEGSNLNYVYQIGVDSSGNTAIPQGVFIRDTFMSNSAGAPQQGCIQNVATLRVTQRDVGNLGWAGRCPGFATAGTVLDVNIENGNSYSSKNSTITGVPGTGLMRRNANGVRSDYNLIPNGGFQFPNLPVLTLGGITDTIAAVSSGTGTGLPAGSKFMTATVSNGAATGARSLAVRVALTEDYDQTALEFNALMEVTTGVTSATFSIKDNAGLTLATTGATSNTGWYSVSANATPSKVPWVTIQLDWTVTSSATTTAVYVNDWRLQPWNNTMGAMQATSPFDMAVGLNGVVAVTTASGLNFISAVLATPYPVNTDYGVISIPELATSCWTSKGGAAPAGSFYIICGASAANVAYQIIPRSGVSP